MGSRRVLIKRWGCEEQLGVKPTKIQCRTSLRSNIHLVIDDPFTVTSISREVQRIWQQISASWQLAHEVEILDIGEPFREARTIVLCSSFRRDVILTRRHWCMEGCLADVTIDTLTWLQSTVLTRLTNCCEPWVSLEVGHTIWWLQLGWGNETKVRRETKTRRGGGHYGRLQICFKQEPSRTDAQFAVGWW